MINLLNLPALRPQSHVLRQGPCSFRQSWNPAVSSCPSLQCSGKVTCHDSHHVSETISMMQAGFEGQPKPWKYPKHWVTSRHSMPATQAGRPLQQKKNETSSSARKTGGAIDFFGAIASEWFGAIEWSLDWFNCRHKLS